MADRRQCLVLLLVLLPLATCQGPPDYSTREGLTGHNGVFQVLPWSEYELALISSLHATANYPALMQLVRHKLLVSDVSTNDRRKIERMLKSLRPPPVFDDFLSEEDAEKVRKAHGEQDITQVLTVIAGRLGELPEYLRDQAVTYITKHTPTTQPPSDSF
ncbi:unnamed protein product [Caenorhabditis sp. 36 PRJEB53466]|nr:unnamed protein product [Caenorhabditis sp. 36 PRJEB53466]